MWTGPGRMSREDTVGPKPGTRRLRQGKVGTQIPGRGAGLNAVSCKVPIRILGHSIGVAEALSVVRKF